MESWKSVVIWTLCDNVTGLIVSAEYKAQRTLSGMLAKVMAHVKPIPINDEMFVKPFATNAVNVAQIHSLWYEDIARIDPAQRNSDPSRAYISVVNESTQWLFSSLTLCIRISQWILAPVQQWYTAARLQSTIFTDFKQSPLERSREW